MTRQQTILAGVLALGLGALLVDWLWLQQTEPRSASAQFNAEQAEQDDLLDMDLDLDDLLERLDTERDRPGFDERLLSLARRHDVHPARSRHLFAATPVVGSTPGQMPEPETSVPEQEDALAEARELIEAFASTYRLQAVMPEARGGGLAIVNGRTLRVGDKLDGMVLRSVSHRRAVFTGPGGLRAELRIGPR